MFRCLMEYSSTRRGARHIPPVPPLLPLCPFLYARGRQAGAVPGQPRHNHTARATRSGVARPYLHCPAATTCTTIEYKSGTRAHIESLGYHVIADFGDQFSDLEGGFTDQTFKLPNPMYFLR
jgi:hypothetical protein